VRAVFEYAEHLTENIKTFWFRPERPVRYMAGQFTEIRLPHRNADERGDKRWFSLSSSPSEPGLAITTRIGSGRLSSFKRQLFRLTPGAELSLSEPIGDFVLPKDQSLPLVFVAGGIGITPMRGMIKWLIDSGEKRDVKLLYAVRGEKEAVFSEFFKQYGADMRVTTNRLSAEDIIAFAGPAENKLIYLAGPEPMIEALFKNLTNLGIDQKQLVVDYFPGYESL
jgi:ferredoxin-NADP reductase